jgi:nucleoid-associated protein YgaU
MWPFGASTAERLQQELDDTGFYGNVTAEVNKKAAVFRGEVTSLGQKTLLETIATSINGIDSADTTSVTVVDKDTSPEDTTSAEVQDATQRADAYRNIQADSALKNAPVDVIRRGNRYVVRGAVASEEDKQRVRDILQQTTGVSEVDLDTLQVVADANTLNQTDDDGDIVYEVKSGDTLSHIALHYYGSASADAYMKIANANGLADPDKIQVGQKLKIPGTHAGPDAKLA